MIEYSPTFVNSAPKIIETAIGGATYDLFIQVNSGNNAPFIQNTNIITAPIRYNPLRSDIEEIVCDMYAIFKLPTIVYRYPILITNKLPAKTFIST